MNKKTNGSRIERLEQLVEDLAHVVVDDSRDSGYSSHTGCCLDRLRAKVDRDRMARRLAGISSGEKQTRYPSQAEDLEKDLARRVDPYDGVLVAETPAPEAPPDPRVTAAIAALEQRVAQLVAETPAPAALATTAGPTTEEVRNG